MLVLLVTPHCSLYPLHVIASLRAYNYVVHFVQDWGSVNRVRAQSKQHTLSQPLNF